YPTAVRNAEDRSCAPCHARGKVETNDVAFRRNLACTPAVFVRPALGDPCVLTVGSLYQLKSDAVDWTMQISSGQTCIRGLRHARVTIDKLVKLLGPGFSYTAKSDFEGQDFFTIQVSGMLNGIRGSSDIRIIVSVGPNVSPQTSPTERSERPPGDLSTAGQPNQNPTAQGTNQTRQVRP